VSFVKERGSLKYRHGNSSKSQGKNWCTITAPPLFTIGAPYGEHTALLCVVAEARNLSKHLKDAHDKGDVGCKKSTTSSVYKETQCCNVLEARDMSRPAASTFEIIKPRTSMARIKIIGESGSLDAIPSYEI
jgi:hypothetical protein